MSDLTPEALRELMNRTVGATSGRDMSPDDLKVLSNELFALAAKPATYNQTLYEGMASYASARTSAAYHAWAADRKRIEALERVRLAAQAVANTWRIAEGSPCVTENEAEDALVDALRGEEER